jgi:NAD(P)-dependent dehydrogenase (short-subunit alcohol dehydrogenase family)
MWIRIYLKNLPVEIQRLFFLSSEENKMTFQGKVALVTGGTSGLGREISKQFAARGSTVVVAGRREAEGLETVRRVEEQGSTGIFVRCDVSNSQDVQNLIEECMRKYGRLDFAINNAGYYGKASFLSKYEEEEFDTVIRINLKGVFLCMKYELGVMLKQGSGSIVNVSSVNGLISMPFGISAYAASKHGILGLTKTGALEVAKKNIRINAVCPGGIETDMLSDVFQSSPNPIEAEKTFQSLHPMGRFARVEEVARVILWLSSEEASYLNGVSIPIDGGLTAH